MQSAKKRVVALSALSMAAVAALNSKSAQGVTFGFYYDNMSILSGPDGSPTSGSDYQDGLVGSAISNSGSATAPATITLTVGQVLEFGMSAAVTGDTAPSAGTQEVIKKTGQGNVPANIGASQLGMQINSSDATGANLLPLSHSTSSTAYLNMSTSSPKASGDYGGGNFNGTGNGQGSNNGSAVQYVPFWTGEIQKGSVNGGGVGSNGGQTISGGSALANTAGEMTNNSTSIESLGEFGASVNNLANATDFFDSLQFQGVSAGTVTLSPFSPTGQDEYWSQTNTATTAASSLWKVEAFGSTAGDTVLAIPQLVVVIAATGTTSTPASPLFSLTTAAPGSAYGSQIKNGSGANNGTFTGPGASNNVLTVVGSNGLYVVAQATGISGGAGTNQGYIAANGFSPATDKEIFALDVEVGGTQASTSQLNTLLTDANSIGGLQAGVSVSTSSPVPNPFPGIYNFFVDYTGVNGDDFLGFDLLSTNDSNLAGYTVSAVAVVPEPMSLGLLALGGVGLMARRNRRKA